ncbi:hypothetical protein HMPREF1992_02217 [Selenomonas sp. oral taxon 892 str. F0426]|uniref:DUF2318 domain-containing protein n=1 Tax=Selenomonas sp. oral taxon 892 TaxID=1321785 RepID=UPI0003AD0566|nr:DUF2318 domain-containing protein [Selenomonas sp. oral taxon 892]ERJ89495.1 hypothetical protein HMPREF1992_02217 [Selenomonas sp. oral taxon 892 str. F0426]
MLQAFLQELVPALEESIKLAVPLGILLAIILPLPNQSIRHTFTRVLKWGFFLSLFMTAVRVGTRSAVNREIFESMAIVLDLTAALVLCIILLRSLHREWTAGEERAFRIGTGALTLGLFLYHGLELWLIPVATVQVAMGEYFTLVFFIKILGFVSGIFFGFLSGYLAYKAAAALNHGRLVFVFTVQIAATAVQQVIFVMTVMMARQVFGAQSLISVMAPFIDNQNMVIYAIYFVSILVPITLFLQPRPERPAWANPAQYRQLVSRAIRRKRWGAGLLAMLILTILVSSAGGWYANKKESLAPAVAVKAVDGLVQIPLEEVSDGHLHRYSYRTVSGTEVRVIIVQKGGSAFGVGLDACEICGATGYFERDGQIVCRLCDVVMNKATIGLPGGCNPIPVEYRVAGGAVQISADTLEAANVHFR